MEKIFISVSTMISTMIVTHFIVRVIDRIKHPEELRKEFEKAERYRKKLEADRMRRAEPKVNVRFESTPRSPDAWMANIGTVGEMAAQYKGIPEPKEPCDGAALRQASIGSAMGSFNGR